jgi:hypothetical protein
MFQIRSKNVYVCIIGESLTGYCMDCGEVKLKTNWVPITVGNFSFHSVRWYRPVLLKVTVAVNSFVCDRIRYGHVFSSLKKNAGYFMGTLIKLPWSKKKNVLLTWIRFGKFKEPWQFESDNVPKNKVLYRVWQANFLFLYGYIHV